jgi:plasmid maintenance system killer protein
MENRHVEREYLDEDLRLLATDPAFRPEGWNDREMREFRRLVQCVRAAHHEDDLRNMRVLRIETDNSGDPGRAQATLSSDRVVNFNFKNSGSHGAVVFGVLATAEMEPQP